MSDGLDTTPERVDEIFNAIPSEPPAGYFAGLKVGTLIVIENHEDRLTNRQRAQYDEDLEPMHKVAREAAASLKNLSFSNPALDQSLARVRESADRMRVVAESAFKLPPAVGPAQVAGVCTPSTSIDPPDFAGIAEERRARQDAEFAQAERMADTLDAIASAVQAQADEGGRAYLLGAATLLAAALTLIVTVAGVVLTGTGDSVLTLGTIGVGLLLCLTGWKFMRRSSRTPRL